MGEVTKVIIGQVSFKTWEHRYVTESTEDFTSLVHCKKVLNKEITDCVFNALSKVEEAFIRFSDPLPPTAARIFREADWNRIYTEALFLSNSFCTLGEAMNDAHVIYGKILYGWEEELGKVGLNQSAEMDKKFQKLGFECGFPMSSNQLSHYYSVELRQVLFTIGDNLEELLGEYSPRYEKKLEVEKRAKFEIEENARAKYQADQEARFGLDWREKQRELLLKALAQKSQAGNSQGES
jgi:hypothetical protein